MYYTEINTIEISFLYDAAMVCKKIGHKLRSIYIDPSGECAISYWGDLALNARARILQNYLPDDVPYEECYQMVQNERYCEWFERDKPNGFTTFYTPDGLDYRLL